MGTKRSGQVLLPWSLLYFPFVGKEWAATDNKYIQHHCHQDLWNGQSVQYEANFIARVHIAQKREQGHSDISVLSPAFCNYVC